MKKALAITLCLALTCATPSLAQDNKAYSGEAELGGGLGSATPWTAGFKGEFGKKLKIMPMVRINGVNRNSSETNEDMQYTFTGIMPLSQSVGYGYQSHANTHSTGFDLDYGLAARYLIDQHSTLSASVKGNVLRLDNSGTQTEQVFAPGIATPTTTAHSTISGTNRNHDIEVAAGYQFLTNNAPGFKDGFAIDYTYTRETDKMTRQQDAQEVTPADLTFNTQFDLSTEGVSEKHRVQGTWMTHASIVQFNVAAFFEDRQLTSNDHQRIEDENAKDIVDEEYHHRYSTAGAFVAAGTRLNGLAVNARLEYDYTVMEGKHLNDFLPTVSVDLNMGRHNKLSARYVRRLIRPSLELLNPFKERTLYTCNYGEPELIGMHVNNIALSHALKFEKASLTSTLAHIFSNDGFNALWMERNLVRNYTWGNEGKRRAYSLTEDFVLTPAQGTKVTAQANVIWDKRIAEAIHMEYEHWGATAKIGVEQKVAQGTTISAHGIYSEGNTVDLYSHEGRTIGAGASVVQELWKNVQLSLNYDFRDYPKLVIAQGSYTGTLYNRNVNKHAVSLNIKYKL